MGCLRFFSFNDVVPLGHLPRDIGTPLRAMRSISENSPFVGVPGGNSLEVPAFGKPAACQTDVGGVDRRKNLGAQFHGKGAPKGVARGNFSRFGRGRSPLGVRDSNEVLSLLNNALSLGGFSATPIACGSRPVAFLYGGVAIATWFSFRTRRFWGRWRGNCRSWRRWGSPSPFRPDAGAGNTIRQVI